MARMNTQPRHMCIDAYNLANHKVSRIVEVITTASSLMKETAHENMRTFTQREVDDYKYHLPSLAQWGVIDVVGERDMGVITLPNGRQIHSFVKTYSFTPESIREIANLSDYVMRKANDRVSRAQHVIEYCTRKECEYAERRTKAFAKIDELQADAEKIRAMLEAL